MQKGMKAYFTVEAVLVLPLVLAAVGLILYLLVYQYNRCILEQDMGMLSVRISSMTLNQEDMVTEFGRLQQGVARQKYLMCVIGTPELNMGPGRVTVSGELQLENMFGGMNEENRARRIETAYENRRISPLFVIRNCEKVKKALRKGEE